MSIVAIDMMPHRRAYRIGVALAVLAAFLTVWGSVVHDDGNAGAFFMVIMAAAVGALAADLRAGGMARTMAGVAVMHMSAAALAATAPITASIPGGPLRYWGFGIVIAAVWLVSAACFRHAARSDRQPFAA